MKHYLLVAHHDGDKAAVWTELGSLAQDGSDFFVVVPGTPPQTGTWTYTDQEAYAIGKQRLDALLGEMSAAGLKASGAILDDSIRGAIQDALQANSYDELIIATPPDGQSRVPFAELEQRIRLFTKIPIRHIVNPQGTEVERG